MKIAVKSLPDGLVIHETDKTEAFDLAKEVDFWKRKEDPTFKGAFHDRKPKSKKKKKKKRNK